MQLLLPLLIAVTMTYQFMSWFTHQYAADNSHKNTGAMTIIMHHKLALNSVEEALKSPGGHDAGVIGVASTLLNSSNWETRFYPDILGGRTGYLVTRMNSDLFSSDELISGLADYRHLLPLSPATDAALYEEKGPTSGVVGLIEVPIETGAENGEFVIISKL